MAEYFSYKDALEAERLCKVERIAAAKYVCFDESKCENAADIMTLRRIKVATEAPGDDFDNWLRDRDGVRLWNNGAWYLERPLIWAGWLQVPGPVALPFRFNCIGIERYNHRNALNKCA